MAAQPSHARRDPETRKLRAGDQDAWERLVSRLHGRVFNLLLRMTGDREASADLTQEAFVAAYASAESFRGQSTPETWVFGIALNCLRNRLRREGARGPTDDLPDDLPDPAPTVEELALLRSRQDLLRKAVDSLPEPYRGTVALHYFAEVSSVEIAAREGVDAGTVRWRLHKALKRLWSVLEPELRREGTL